jgi:hypothetical protein
VPIEHSLLAVIWHYWKARIFRLSSLLLGFDGLGFFLVAMGFGRSSCVAFVPLNFSRTTIVA